MPNLNLGHTGFLLDKLILKHNKVFGESFEISFFDLADFPNSDSILPSPYTTLIIGPNGTGKSLILKIISDIILDLYTQKIVNENNKRQVNKKVNSDHYYFSYYIGTEYYEIQNFDDVTDFFAKRKIFNYSVKINHKSSELSALELPGRLLVSSLLLTDRFTVYKDPPEFYKYLGVRSLTSPSTAKTRNYVKRTVEYVVNALADLETEMITKIKSVLSFLEFRETFFIYYYPRYKGSFYTGNLTVEAFSSLFEHYNDSKLGFSERANAVYQPFGVEYYNKNLKNNNTLISDIVGFLNELVNSNRLKKEDGSRSEYFEYDILNSELSLEKYLLLKNLASLDLVTYPTILLSKNNGFVDLEDSSSGEYNFISTIIGIYASLKPNSLILIDEPEISLHPNWQLKYMSFLKKTFSDFSDCHFIIATHSHFFTSDLDGKSSMIIGLTNIEKNIKRIDVIKNNTFGWSAENVLYNVFKVRTTRNHYIESDVMELVSLLENKSVDFDMFRVLLQKFELLELMPEDPLNELVNEAKSYLNGDITNS